MSSDGSGTVTPMRNSASYQNPSNSKYFEGQSSFVNKKAKLEEKTIMAPPALPMKK